MPRPLRRPASPPTDFEPYDDLDGDIPDLNAQHAVVHTATIDVSVLRLEGKQMTLSVFRQIPEGPILDGLGELRGEPWGRVLYTWDKAVAWADYYVVWQDSSSGGDHLRRTPLPLIRLLGSSYKEPRSGRWIEKAHGLLHWLGVPGAHHGMHALPEAMLDNLRAFEALDQLFIAV